MLKLRVSGNLPQGGIQFEIEAKLGAEISSSGSNIVLDEDLAEPVTKKAKSGAEEPKRKTLKVANPDKYMNCAHSLYGSPFSGSIIPFDDASNPKDVRLFVNPKDFVLEQEGKSYASISTTNEPKKMVIAQVTCGNDIFEGDVALCPVFKALLDISTDTPVHLEPRKPGRMAESVILKIVGTRSSSTNYCNADKLHEALGKKFDQHIIHKAEAFSIYVTDTAFKKNSASYRSIDTRDSGLGITLECEVVSLMTKPITAEGIGQVNGSEEAALENEFGLVDASTKFEIELEKNVEIEFYGKMISKQPILPDGVLDFEKLGIGGLKAELTTLFEHAFAARLCPPELIAELGMDYVRGVLLHGPPGTGKTLIARVLSKILRSRPPKIVNGPELLNMYVGQSEEHGRKLFEDAEREYAAVGENSRLHVIICDEFDVLCPNRAQGGSQQLHKVDINVVSQLISKLDGVEQLNNLLVIGMTNHKDLIDPTILREGRIEVHLEIPLPDEEGRRQILHIHTAKMRENNRLDESVDLERICKQTVNFSGAKLAGLVRAAIASALKKLINADGLGIRAVSKEEAANLKVTMEDFESALKKIVPAFDSSSRDFQHMYG